MRSSAAWGRVSFVIRVAAGCAMIATGSVAGAAEKSLTIGFAAGMHSGESLGIGDVRPQFHAWPEGVVEFEFARLHRWAVRVGAGVYGSRYTFGDLFESGRLDEVGWTGKIGFDRFFASSEPLQLKAGVGFEYGEERSWLKGTSFDQEGPRHFTSGGSVRLTLHGPAWRGVRPHGWIEEAVVRTHARRPAPAGSYEWFGSSFRGFVGLQTTLWSSSN